MFRFRWNGFLQANRSLLSGQMEASRLLRTMRKRLLPQPVAERRLDVTILGAPNAGKSVILNTIVKARLAAISHKRHTTRSEILGVFNHRNVQLAFHDTPGFVRSSEARKLDTKTLQSLVRGAASRADVVLLVVDAAREITPNFQDTFAEMAKIAIDNAKIEIILVLNKVDLVEPKSRLIEITRQLVSLINGVKLGPEGAHLAQLDTTTFMISALHNDGVIDLKNYLISLAPRKPWIIPKSEGKTDLSPEERVEQILLQVMLEHTHEEIPYIAEYQCLKISNLTPNRIKIETEILVDVSNQQRIVIGEKGRTLLKLRQSAVDLLEDIFGKEVILMINVRSRDNKKSSDNNMKSNTQLDRGNMEEGEGGEEEGFKEDSN